tara:strand:- start:7544 stop:9385 length:1842 start_codon:yes stop_codon:yes gene_type:complete
VAITLKRRYTKEFNPKSGVIGTQYTKNKYSKDISGGAYSGQPFIKRELPGIDDKPIGQYYDLSTQALSLDFPIRGGSYEEIASREDFARIDRFFLYYPQGKAFTDKYRALLRSNPKIETGREQGDSNTRVFPIGNSGLGSRNMIEQIASVGTGFHVPNAGSDIFSLTEQEDLYGRIVAKKPTNENRLVSLYNLKILPEPTSDFNPSNPTVINSGLSTIRDTVELINYEGGPNSLYGIGTTLIRRATDNKGAIINTYDAPKFVGPFSVDLRGNDIQSTNLGSTEINYDSLLGLSGVAKIDHDINIDTGVINETQINNLDQQTDGSIRITNDTDTKFKFASTSRYDQLMKMGDNNNGTITVNDFRKNVDQPSQVNSRDYTKTDINKTTRVGIGNPGARPADKTANINDTNDDIGKDLVNRSEIQSGEALFGGENRDFIKFGFDVIGNDSGTPFKSVHFRAFLTGYNDSHEGQWDSKRYAGRGENFYTYQGFDRTVSFNFKIAAQSKQDMAPLYKKLNFLLSTLYPDYSDNGFMRGNIVRLTLGDLFVRQPGILQSLNMTVADEYPWEIAFDEPEGGSSADMKETPQIIDVAATFKPILYSLPKLESNILMTKMYS